MTANPLDPFLARYAALPVGSTGYRNPIRRSADDVPTLVAAARASFAQMDGGKYGDPEVPFRMRAAFDAALTAAVDAPAPAPAGVLIPAELLDPVTTALFAYLHETLSYLRGYETPDTRHDACCDTHRQFQAERERGRLSLVERRDSIRAALLAVGSDPDE